jgi:hypothetical protein
MSDFSKVSLGTSLMFVCVCVEREREREREKERERKRELICIRNNHILPMNVSFVCDQWAGCIIHESHFNWIS